MKFESKSTQVFPTISQAAHLQNHTTRSGGVVVCSEESAHFPCPNAAFGSLWFEGRSELFALFGFAFCEGHLAFRDVDRDGVAVDDATFDQLHRERVEYAVLNDAL